MPKAVLRLLLGCGGRKNTCPKLPRGWLGFFFAQIFRVLAPRARGSMGGRSPAAAAEAGGGVVLSLLCVILTLPLRENNMFSLTQVWEGAAPAPPPAIWERAG